MSTNIVVVNVSVTTAPAPSTLQQTGAFISQGGTTTAANTLTLLPNLAALTAILAAPKTLTSLSWTSSTVTGTTTTPHGWTNGDVVSAIISGASPAAYNGTFTITVTGASTFTYPLASNPGSETVPGTVILASESELLSMGTTFFAQNGQQSVYVLELGEGTPTEGVTALSTWITNNPKTVYSYLVPREWDNNSTFLAFIPNYDSPSKKTYFFVTTTVANRAVYAGHKCVLAEVEAPAIPATEFSLAGAFAVTLNYNPGSSNQVPPLSYSYVYGVTAYPIPNNTTVFNELAAANVGWIGTGAEGGISNTILFQGQMQDGNPFNYWYSADWVQLNAELNLANEVINGSNDNVAPLYYDQNGINRLQARAVQTLNTAVSNGLANGSVKATRLPAQQFIQNYLDGDYLGYIVVNAEPFLVYTTENPSDYSIGKYAGLTCVYTPSRGFLQITFNLNVTDLTIQ